MRNAVLFLGVVLAVCRPAAAQGTDWANKLFDETKKDFGTCPRGAQLKHRFQITNIYKVPLTITDVRVTCGCLTHTLTSQTIQPNQVAFMDINMDATKFSNHKSIDMHVSFQGKDAAGQMFASVAHLIIQANARQDVTFNPGSVNFGVVGRGQAPIQNIEVEYAGNLDWQIQEIVKNASAPFSVSAEEMYRIPPRAGGVFKKPIPGKAGYRLTLKLKPDAAVGPFKHELILKTNDLSSPMLMVAVEGKIQASLSVLPQVVKLGVMKIGESKTQKVLVRGNRPFRISAVESNGEGLKVELPDKAQENQVVVIHCQPTEPGEFRRQLQIRTDLDNETVTVQVEGKVTGEKSAAAPK